MDNKNADSVSPEIYISLEQFLCKICQKELPTNIQYQVHSIIHLLPENFEYCHDCQVGYEQILALNKHLETHENHMCVDSLYEHVPKHNNESTTALVEQRDNLFKCGKCKNVCHDCQKGFTHILNMEKHLEIHNTPVCIACHVCKKEFSDTNSLNEHAEEHNGVSANASTVQQVASSDKMSVEIHYNEKHASSHTESSEKSTLERPTPSPILENVFRCERCKKGFTEKSTLEEHYQNDCNNNVLKIDEGEDFLPLSLVSTVFHASDDEGDTLPEFSKQSKSRRVLKNVRTKNTPKTTQFVCEMCHETFSNKCSLAIHFSTHRDPWTFKCRLCEKKFSLKSLLNAHLRTHKIKKVFCGVCQKSFSSKQKLFNHVYVHALVETFSCNICQMTFSEQALLQKHHLQHNAENISASEAQHSRDDRMQNLDKHGKCEKEFIEKDRVHTHKKAKSFPCNVCQLTFSEKSLLVKHRLIHTSEKTYMCEICNKKLATKKSLNAHMQRHSGLRPYVCVICSKRFANQHNFNRHKLIHTGERAFKCETCGASFNRKDILTTHQLTHKPKKTTMNLDKPCNLCSKKSKFKSSAKSGDCIHMKKKPFKCWKCGKRFPTKHSLIRHQYTHTGYTPYVCEICNKGFYHKSSLLSHSFVHQGHAPHECDVCQKGFSTKAHLKRHLLTHTGEKPFACKLCDRKYTQKTHLNRHLKKEHGQ